MSFKSISVLFAFASWTLTGCMQTGYGEAAFYNDHMQNPPHVVVPQSAPSIFQQFRYIRHDPVLRGQEGDHFGIDIKGQRGTPILAAAPGVVHKSYFEPGFGHRVEIDLAPNFNGHLYRTIYMHLDERLANPGETIKRGEKIATMGKSGAFSGAILHLHFEVFRLHSYGWLEPIDPNLLWLDGSGRVTCFDGQPQTSGLTYPVPCR